MNLRLMRRLPVIVAGVVGCLGLVAVIWLAVFVFGWITAKPTGRLQARQQINSGNYRIQAYNHFFDLCASVTTMDEALNQSYADLTNAKGDDRSRIETNITAQLNDRNDAANQYNADAHKGYTVGQFRASNLPYSIPRYTKGGVFTCGS